MENIALAKKIDFKHDNNLDGSIIVEPLYPGYGNTIGNALRRVLLSSLPGSAVVGVKIKGAKHEFMALPGVKEDILDIILNLKQLRLKILTDTEEILKLELNVQGKKQVTAKDIKKDSQIEIVNSDLVLGNITDPTGSLIMEIYVANGRGYFLADKTKKDVKEVDYIEVDSIFSPILGISYKVENVRVGKMTNWDKLILEIKTDGTISLEEAFDQSVAILIDQFKALVNVNGSVEVDSKDEIVVEKKKKKESIKEDQEEEPIKPKKKKKE
ncbi:MAG: DNA-directed RNA polymerase subunit alpha [Patescibacteria group bacterium]|jgi:DNA-directed RNA polymerase subunit alpha